MSTPWLLHCEGYEVDPLGLTKITLYLFITIGLQKLTCLCFLWQLDAPLQMSCYVNVFM